MTDVPALTPVATPLVALTVATVAVPLDQAEAVVTLIEVPSAKLAVATNCCAPPIVVAAVAGETATETNAAAGIPKIGSRP